jgi:hypothetical protein
MKNINAIKALGKSTQKTWSVTALSYSPVFPFLVICKLY